MTDDTRRTANDIGDERGRPPDLWKQGHDEGYDLGFGDGQRRGLCIAAYGVAMVALFAGLAMMALGAV